MANTNTNIIAGSWKTLTQLPVAGISNGYLLTDNQHLFMVGGATDAATSGTRQVYAAVAHADGSIGNWRQVGAVPKTMAFFSGTLENNNLIVLVGGNTTSPLNTVYSAEIQSDGQLSSFITTSIAGITTGRNPGVAQYRGKTYYVGGNTTGQSGAAVLMGSVNAVSGEAAWSVVTPLPMGLLGGYAFAYENFLYYVGGSTTGLAAGAIATVYSAPINGDGTLGSWTAVANMPATLHRFAAVVYKGRLIVLGGQDTTSANSRMIYWANLSRGGKIGSFNTDDAQLPVAQRNGHAAVIGNRLFLAGGFTTDRIPNVWSTPLSY